MKGRVENGARIVGHKIGLTSRVMQMTSKIDEPAHGHVLNDMHYFDGATVPVGRFLQPPSAVDLAFMLGRPVNGPNAPIFAVLDAPDSLVLPLEITTYRTAVPPPNAPTN